MSEGRTIDEQVAAIKTLPTPQDSTELREQLQILVTGGHSPDGLIDYNEGPFIMAAAAYLAFSYAASYIGATGFQASGAELMFLAASRGMTGPFGIVDAEHMLYPQYDLPAQVAGWINDWKQWASVEAQKLLDERDRNTVADSVWEHWERLAGA